MFRTIVLLLGSLTLSPATFADDDDDPFGGLDDPDDESGDDDEIPPPPPPKTGTGSQDPDTQFEDTDFDEDIDVGARKEGEDDARIYREQVEKMKRLNADQELLEWERYLKKYPASIFKSRIQDRISELSTQLFDTNLGASSESGLMEAGKAEIRFAQPFTLESIDPRRKVRIGLEWGFPSYINLLVDYEHQLKRNWSVHAGARRRYTGWNIEAGTRYAIVKSARTNMLVTGILDGHLNMNPAFFGLRPMVGVGKRFNVLSGLDVMAQAGTDLPFGYGDHFSPWYIGGANVTLSPSEIVRVWAETSISVKELIHNDLPPGITMGSFRFNTVTVGIQFVSRKGKTTDLADISAGAELPYATNYWAYHFGAVAANANIYLQ